MKQFHKTIAVKALSGTEVTLEMLAKINGYVLKTGGLKTEEVYVRKLFLANNGIDRDQERFPETLLDDFARTLPGKSVLLNHDKRGDIVGLYFDASTEEMSPDKYFELTGEKIILPEGISTAKVLQAWFYTLDEPFNQKFIKKVDAGILRHVSIGFGAADLVNIKNEGGQTLFWEYTGPGEGREGSFVWLGAQRGATAQKQPNEKNEASTNGDKKQGANDMDITVLLAGLKTIIACTKELTEGNVLETIKAAFGKKDAEIIDLKSQVEVLTPKAADGDAYRKSLVDDVLHLGGLIGEFPTGEKEQEEEGEVLFRLNH